MKHIYVYQNATDIILPGRVNFILRLHQLTSNDLINARAERNYAPHTSPRIVQTRNNSERSLESRVSETFTAWRNICRPIEWCVVIFVRRIVKLVVTVVVLARQVAKGMKGDETCGDCHPMHSGTAGAPSNRISIGIRAEFQVPLYTADPSPISRRVRETFRRTKRVNFGRPKTLCSLG